MTPQFLEGFEAPATPGKGRERGCLADKGVWLEELKWRRDDGLATKRRFNGAA
ncbi:MAG: hypothetical protein OXJ53_15010 [Gammaproteobacteria bacterium]|nr:hypothetical protein [Gammaproteobacteria bacterium]MDE0270042.1 hypothetical protein [Gammaproteobacteria bacterium]